MPDPLAALLAAAFHDGAVAVWVEPHDEARRRRMLDALFGAFTEHVFLPRKRVDRHGDPLNAAAVWSPPSQWDLSDAEAAAVNDALAAVIGDDLERMGTVLADAGARHPSEPHWYLDFLGTDPDRRGQGLGSAVLRPGLDRCDADQLPAYLWTGKDSNLPFYERHGFEVTWSVPLADGLDGWGMWREPRRPL